jgi:methyl-accepting chemotaxis protein
MMNLFSLFKRGDAPQGTAQAAQTTDQNTGQTDPSHADEFERIVTVCQRASAGDLEARLIHINNDSPNAAMMHAINRLLDITDAFVREAGASLDYVSREKYFRRVLTLGLPGDFRRAAEIVNRATDAMGRKVAEFNALAGTFENNIKSVVDGVAATATEMNASSQSLATIADTAKERAHNAAQGAQMTSQNVQEVASATQEFTASVEEINRHVAHSAEISHQAVIRAEESKESVLVLTQTAEKIDEVTRLIQEIASQTNLLALNATIEAARAGEAGKGFAVVAHEVKGLASQTAKATEGIAAHISAIQNASSNVSEAIKGIGETISEFDEIATAISSAVEQQRAASEEIARNIQSAADGTQETTTHVKGVTETAQETESSAQEVLLASSELSKQSERLTENVNGFLETIRQTA